MNLAGPLSPNLFNFVAAAGGTCGDGEHGLGLSEGLLGRDEEAVGFYFAADTSLPFV